MQNLKLGENDRLRMPTNLEDNAQVERLISQNGELLDFDAEKGGDADAALSRLPNVARDQTTQEAWIPSSVQVGTIQRQRLMIRCPRYDH